MAFKIAVSGLKAASADLDVTGNNIANSNTVGFKESRAQFADVYAVSNLGSASDAIGQGVQLSAVAQQFNQGNISFTDNSLDLAINGEGFFSLESNGARSYTRSGQFGVDKDGFVVNGTGQNLLAFGANNGAITGAVGPLQLTTSILAPQPTTNVGVEVNLDAADSVALAAFDPSDATSYNNSTSLTVFDSLGAEHLATVYMRKTGVNSWDTHVRVDNDNTQTLATQSLAFDTNGNLTAPVGNVSYGAYTPTTGAAPFTLNYNFTGTTQVGADFGVFSLSQDGYTSGQLSGIDIDQEGVVLARFSNGQSQAQGQVVLANFGNPQGLQPVSESNWAETNSSGPPLTGGPGSASLGLLQAGAVEESNVDLSEQLVNMIVAQRNFQANAQMIRAEDEVTQTIINIR
jgi:flagellar hook protein FlgE